MKILRLFGRSLLWMLVLGLASGIFGVSYSIARITDFYLRDGTAARSELSLRIIPSEGKPLLKTAVSDLKNIEGIVGIFPYFLPQGTVTGSVEYFGFKESMPIKIKGIPTDLGAKSVAGAYQQDWNSAASEKIPVLIPKRAIDLYNAAAPGRGWPVLPQDTFLGLPGLSLSIGDRRFEVLSAGFDNNEIGISVSAPAEKLYTIYEELKLNPEYTYIDLTLLEGLNKTALANLEQSIKLQGYALETSSTENVQIRLLQRVKSGFLLLGALVLLSALFLKVLFSILYYRGFLPRRRLQRLWGVKSHFLPGHIIAAVIFSALTALLAWGICFFWIIPIQQPLMQNLGLLGFKLPPLELSAESAIHIGIAAGFLHLLSDGFNLSYFYWNTPLSSIEISAK